MFGLALLALAPPVAPDVGATETTGFSHLDLEIELGALPPLRAEPSGVATIQYGPGPGPALSVRIPGGPGPSGTIPVTDPDATSVLPSIRIDAALGTGELTGIFSAPAFHVADPFEISGLLRFCLYTPGCAASIDVPMTMNGGQTGFGVGGLLTGGSFQSIRISIVNSPWTIGTVSAVNQTASGGFVTKTRSGFMHGPFSATTTVLSTQGTPFRLVASQQITTTGIPGFPSALASFSTLEIQILEIPEPGFPLLILSGAVGLAWLGRSSRRR